MLKREDKCNRKKLLIKELINDWDELNISFKALIIIGMILFIVVIFTAIYSDGVDEVRNSFEVVFRSTLASVFGFLLSSNIKANSSKRNNEIEKIKSKILSVQKELDSLDDTMKLSDNECKLEDLYTYKDINLVQIIIALSICIICIAVICILIITNNLDNLPAVSQIRDLMCSSIGFLIGESKKK